MKLILLVIASVALLSILVFALRGKDQDRSAVVQAEVQQHDSHSPLVALEATPTSQGEAVPAPVASTVVPTIADLAPDGKPWTKTMLIGDPDSKKTFTVEWIGDMKRLIHDNGVVYAEMSYVNGKKEGTTHSWHRNGQPWSTSKWINGKREGNEVVYSSSGVLLARGAYKSGYCDGLWERWHPNGMKRDIGSFNSAPEEWTTHQVGQWSAWNDDGSVDDSQTGYFENGVRIRP